MLTTAERNIVLSSPRLNRQKEYWQTRLGTDMGITEIPSFLAKKESGSLDRGTRIPVSLPMEVSKGLIKLGKKSDLSLYILLLTAVKIFIHRYTGSSDITVQSPMLSQNITPETFNRKVVIRDNVAGAQTFLELLLQTRQSVLEAYENQDYPLEEILAKETFSNLSCTLKNIHPAPSVGEPNCPLSFEFRREGERVEGDILFVPNQYGPDFVGQIARHLAAILQHVNTDIHCTIATVPLLTEAELKSLLLDFNRTGTAYPRDKTIHEIFGAQMEKKPDYIALILPYPVPASISYRELNRRANALAILLRKKGVLPDTIVGYMAKRSLEMIIGILGILKSGGAYLPIDPGYPADRIRYMLADSASDVAVTMGEVPFPNDIPVKIHIQGMDSVSIPFDCSEEKALGSIFSQAEAENLAYVIYTSGSTGKPKGILTTHYNVTRVVCETNYIKITPEDRLLQLSNYAFDGSIFDIYGALLNGGALVLLPEEKVPAVERLAEIVISENITVFLATTALFNLMTDETPWVFKGIRKVLFGGERASVAHTRRALEYMGKGKIIHAYGPTETTVCATYYFIHEIGDEGNVPIGTPVANTSVYILDPYLNPVPIGVVGELYIGGPGTARGYLNNPELTSQKFIKNFMGARGSAFQDHTSANGEQTLYKSGDLGRRLPEGAIEFLGRVDHQVKIRGFRIEPGEIKARLLKHESIKDAVVEVIPGSGNDKYLCAYFVPRGDVSPTEIKKYLAEHLPEYMIPTYFIKLEKIPLTSNGKLDRKALPEPGATTDIPYTAPQNKIEKKLAELWADILAADPVKIGIDVDFFKIGGHSLNATILIGKIHKELNIKVPLTQIFAAPTVRKFAAVLAGMAEERFMALQPVEKKEYYPVSPAQKRLYILQQVETGNTAYNMPYVVPLKFVTDVTKLEIVFKQLLCRHESLRTSFYMIHGEPVQKVHEEVEFTVEHRESAFESTARDFLRAFDLSQAPLLRVQLLKVTDSEDIILLIDMHHIITDGMSQEILIKEFAALYAGEKLPPLRLQYKDYAQWRQHRAEQGEFKQQELYWLSEFQGELPPLNLPTDYPRPRVRNYAGGVVLFDINAEKTGLLRTLATEIGATLYMALLAAFNIFLTKICGQEEIVTGTPTSGRGHADLNNIIGMFVNTLALRLYPEGSKTVATFLREVKDKTLTAFENQDYPFEDLVDRVDIQRNMSRNPLFDVMFVLQNITIISKETAERAEKKYEHTHPTAKFDLTLVAWELGEQLFFSLEYSSKLFRRETIERLIEYFKQIVRIVSTETSIKIEDMEIISIEEKQRLLIDFNNTKTPYPGDKTIQYLFAEQVEKNSDRIALVLPAPDPAGVTYRELNRQADALAAILSTRGVTTDTIVALMAERSVEMMVGIWGILKAGGAYLPIETAYPAERIHYMLTDSGVNIMVTAGPDPAAVEIPAKIGIGTPIRDNPFHSHDSTNAQGNIIGLCPSKTRADNLAYVIYTSGSTGKPKGVLTTHYNVTRVVRQTNYIELTGGDRLLQLSNYAFDGSVFDIYGALLNGGGLILLPGEKTPTVERLAEVITKEKITVFFVTTALFNLLTDEVPGIFKRIRKILFGGERVSVEHVRRALGYAGKGKIIHVYGPTETTVYATFYFIDDLPADAVTIPIGRPLANTSVYILDHRKKTLPTGITGEFYIGGAGAARGYLNNPEFTFYKFIETPLAAADRLYRTGDLVRWLPEGVVEFIGRIDHQVKIRGFRIEPGEINSQLLGHKSVKAAVTEVITGSGGDQYLCTYYVPRATISTTELRGYLAKHLPGYMIPTYFVPLARIPLTANGKLDRKALPGPGEAMGAEYTAPCSSTEQKLAVIWSEILFLEKEKISTDADFFRLGGHSLKATLMTGKIHKELNVKVPLSQVFATPTIRQLAEKIDGMAVNRYSALQPAEQKEYYPLSSAQKRLFVLQQMEAHNLSYNMPIVFPLERETDIRKSEDIFKKLIARHESFRTSFHLAEGGPIQRVHDYVEFSIEYREDTFQEGIRDFIQPFDLSRAPLIRTRLLKVQGTEDRLLLIDMHHIITDGTSQEILGTEFAALKAGKKLPPLRLQYKDYCQWQQERISAGTFNQQEAYWLEEFRDTIWPLNLPTDFPRPVIRSFEGRIAEFEPDVEQIRHLKELSHSMGVTLYMTFLALYSLFLAKISNREDIVTGTPSAGRGHADLANIMGMFVNTLVLRLNPQGEKTFPDFLREVKEKTLAAFENQDYPFEELVDKVEVERDMGRNPLFDAMFVYQNIFATAGAGKETAVQKTGYTPEHRVAKFDLSLVVGEVGDKMHFSFEYCTKLFRAETMARFVLYFKKMIASVLQEPGGAVGQIEIITEEEKQQVLCEFNGPSVSYFKDNTVHRLFEAQVEKTPHRVAIIGSNDFNAVTYCELNEQSSRLSQLLETCGVIPETVTGVLLERSPDMITAILGILKAGGVYLPMDTSLPRNRIHYMLADSDARILITREAFRQGLTGVEIIEPGDSRLENCTPHNPTAVSAPGRFLYVIYTSGSTGKPKGVLVEHRGFVNLLACRKKVFNENPDSRMSQVASPSFDAAAAEIWPCLVNGGALFIADYETCADFRAMKKWLITHKITMSYQPTVIMEQLLQEEWPEEDVALRIIQTAGDRLTRFPQRHYPFRLYNLYGPTEDTVWATWSEVEVTATPVERQFPDIGRPVDNHSVFIVDGYFNLQPVGIPGELCIEGAGLASGYINNPELTATKFVNLKNAKWLAPAPATRLYRTGDLAAWLPNGKISFRGRVDHQVKIRGYRIEPDEIRCVLAAHPEIKEAVVTITELQEGEPHLCAYYIPQGHVTESGLRDYLSSHLPAYMIPSYFMSMDRIPLTPNGKIDRKALPQPEIKGEEYTAPRDEMETKLARIWADVLNRSDIGIDDNFFRLGGHSLKATQVAASIYKIFDVKLSLAELFKAPTVRKLAAVIANTGKSEFCDLVKIEKRDYYELSYNQRRLWIIHRMEPENAAAYNMYDRFRLQHRIDDVVVKKTLLKLIERHESFRTTFRTVNNRPVQCVLDHIDIPFKRIDLSNLEELDKHQQLEHSFNEEIANPFDPDQIPLFRFVLIKTAEEDYYIMFTMHHIISDGWSMEILKKEFTLLYNSYWQGAGVEPERPEFQYKDFAHWQEKYLRSTEVKKLAHSFWRKVLEKELPQVTLPVDTYREEYKNNGAVYRSVILTETKERLVLLAENNNTSLFILMVSLFNLLLSRVSGQSDIVIGLAVSGREHISFRDIVGFFVNTVVLHTTINHDQTFLHFLQDVNNHVMEVLEYQGYPLELAARDLNCKFPEINVFINMLNLDQKTPSRELISLESLHKEEAVHVKFDLMLYVMEYKNAIQLNWSYKKALFRPATITALMDKYQKIINFYTTNPGKHIIDYKDTTPDRKKRSLKRN